MRKERILITIEQVKYFLAINTYKSFSVAAEELNISQSSLSKQIKALETELDTTLFNRNTRMITLTESGNEFIIHAQSFLNNYENIMSSMKKYSKEKCHTINIGTIPVIAQYGITSAIASFKNKYPHININLIEGERDEIIDMLNKSEIDFAFVRDFGLNKYLFTVNTLVSDELVLVVSKNHPLAKKKYVDLEEIRDEDFILLSSASGMDTFCTEQCNAYGFSPNIIYSLNKIETILGLVSDNIGVSLLMKRVLDCFYNKNTSIILFKKTITNSLSLIHRNDKALSENKLLFKDFIINFL